MEILFTPDALIALLTLTFLEIILGIDNKSMILESCNWISFFTANTETETDLRKSLCDSKAIKDDKI